MAFKSKIVKICEGCGGSYNPRNDRIKTSKYCSMVCTKKPRLTKVCRVCKCEYTTWVYREKVSSFCSRKCQLSLKGEDHFSYGAREKKWSYVLIGKRELDDICKICKSNSKKLHIHHIDTDRNNFHKENLCKLCRGCHHKVHFLIRQGADFQSAINDFFYHYERSPIHLRLRHKPIYSSEE